jgi:hypothetical protein
MIVSRALGTSPRSSQVVRAIPSLTAASWSHAHIEPMNASSQSVSPPSHESPNSPLHTFSANRASEAAAYIASARNDNAQVNERALLTTGARPGKLTSGEKRLSAATGSTGVAYGVSDSPAVGGKKLPAPLRAPSAASLLMDGWMSGVGDSPTSASANRSL